MQQVKLQENTTIRNLLVPLSRAAGTVNSSVVDQIGSGEQYYGDALALVVAGAATGSPTAQSVTVKLQHSDDNSVWADVAGKSVVVSADNGVGEIAFSPNAVKRYRRYNCVTAFTAGTSPEIPYGVLEIDAEAGKVPA